jgi:uncharacterized phage protein gp47/JayE
MTTSTYTSQQSTILQNMIAYMQNTANWPDGVPKVTDFSVGSVTYTLLSAVAVAIDTNGYAIFMARQAAYISTAVGPDLDNKAADYGITRKPALAASGTFNFTKNTASVSPTDIPAGTLISTIPDSSGNVVTYVTTADATLPAGQTSVTVSATCQTTGTTGNLAANTPLLISSPVVGIDGVQVTQNITNGVNVESDDQLRQRTLNAFAALAIGTLAWYQQTALSVTGIQSATVVPQNRGPGTVDIFIVGENNTIPSSTLQSQVQTALNNGRPCTDDAKEQTPTALTINAPVQIHLLSGYDPTITSAAVQTAITNYINNLGCGANTLGYVYASQLIAVAMSITGVANATTTFTDTAVGQYQLPQAGAITVTTF